ncbi:hypothetical protein N7532_011575 [Penicillium argentinense]|uniref:Major facilitator superfamily (MFS) profile domain-containing protein n=1 Tax=Penicillium argentinense TaxID=1131581 RepID=A0A9W9JVD3_9EURO|nr:uncharacterized protein N7532_011575 [Penicillium argentinense]KAJ5082532.1 hypothetical protein N7532_011575 [Penicillium argentinense]
MRLSDEIIENEVLGTVKSEQPIPVLDPVAEKRLLWKLDIHIVPVLTLLFLLAFLDRINIGNARLQGLEEDLNMKGHDYNIALFIFFIPYILFEVPCNLILKKVAPSWWISGLMTAWGIVTVCQGVTQSFGGLVACRFLLGVFEAGFMPGCVYLIAMYYKRYELQWRLNVYFSASIMAGALLAYAIANMAGIGGYNGWRWIFIIEGLATIVAAIASKFLIVDWPETAKFLSEDERALLLLRLKGDRGEARMDRLDGPARKRILGDIKIWLGPMMYFGIVNGGYATSFFTPTILKQLGWTAVRAQVMSIPIYVVATVVSLCVALASDKLRHRFAFTIAGCLVATVGFVMLLCQESIPRGARYFALYAVTCGGYMTQPILLGWISNNMAGHYKQSVASAMQVGIGNAGGLVASNIFFDSEAPLYPTGYGVSLGMVWICGLACIICFFWIRRENRLRDEGKRDDRYRLPEDELSNLGDDHPSFRYTS